MSIQAYPMPSLEILVLAKLLGILLSHSLIELLTQSGLELQALKSKWHACSVSTGEHDDAESLTERRTSCLLADLNDRISALRMALKAISVMKANPHNWPRLKRAYPCNSTSSNNDTHLKSPRTAKVAVLDEISEDWVDLSVIAGETDAEIIPLPLLETCGSRYLVIPHDQGEFDEANAQRSDTTSSQPSREVEPQTGGLTPKQEQQELATLATAVRDKEFILQEAPQAARVTVSLDSAEDLLRAIEKYEESSLLLEEIEDLFKDTEERRKRRLL